MIQYFPHGGFEGDTGAGRKTSVLSALISNYKQANARDFRSILVVGCGDGSDARSLAEYFDCKVTAIDLCDYFDTRNADRVRFMRMNACELKFADSSFSLVYSFHALEHMPDYRKAICEIRRALEPSGTYCIGTPNRARLGGYIGVPSCSLMEKIKANAVDWALRLQRRFKNEFGAHAGYTARELLSICNAIGPGQDVSNEYYLRLYPRWETVLRAIIRLRLSNIAWPSVYIVGSKAERTRYSLLPQTSSK